MPLGEIPGISIGDTFPRRMEMLNNGLHRNLQQGIVNFEITFDNQPIPVAESIVLSDGYVDDLDFGNLIIYTGQGGRDEDTGRQVRNQEWTSGNEALKNSCDHSTLVRVIKKRKVGRNDYNYEYSGLYMVLRAWSERGEDGFDICRFLLVKDDNDLLGKLRNKNIIISITNR